jgi:acyl-CoA reductase-like NAD-dependent aldehyde dehydrogenase
METLEHFVDGTWTSHGDKEVLDHNPADPSTVVARYLSGDPALVDEAVDAAARAFPAWRATPAPKRAEVLLRVAAQLDAQADTLGRELVAENGKTLPEAVGEVLRTSQGLRYFASEVDRPVGEVFYSSREHEDIRVLREPLGVIGAIAPYNFPLFIPAFKIATAIVFGNTVVMKPAPITPLVAARLVRMFEEAGAPKGVVNMVLGGADVGERLATHPQVAAVSFTGSAAVGRILAIAMAPTGKPLQAEMGGKNAAIVLADADLDHAAAEIAKGTTGMAGQKCTATGRVIVASEVYDGLMERLVTRVGEVHVGPPLEPSTAMGPLGSELERAKTLAHVTEASEAGARVLTGGKLYEDGPLADGYFFPGTVVEAGPDQAIWTEEVFGPVVVARRADDDEHALALANDSRYGLSGAVFTRSLARAQRAIDLFEVGSLHINSQTTGADIHVPFGGFKDSGSHSWEMGRAARDFVTRVKTVYVAYPTD